MRYKGWEGGNMDLSNRGKAGTQVIMCRIEGLGLCDIRAGGEATWASRNRGKGGTPIMGLWYKDKGGYNINAISYLLYTNKPDDLNMYTCT